MYAERPAARALQVGADLGLLVWVLVSVRVATGLHDLVARLAGPGRAAEAAGRDLAESLTGAGDRTAGVPLVGDAISGPLRRAADAAGALARAGADQQALVERLASSLALVLAVLAIGYGIARWLPWRVRWLRAARAARALRSDPDGAALLAVRAVASQPLHRLAALPAGTVEAWHRGDPAATRALAALELRGLGLLAEGAERPG